MDGAAPLYLHYAWPRSCCPPPRGFETQRMRADAQRPRLARLGRGEGRYLRAPAEPRRTLACWRASIAPFHGDGQQIGIADERGGKARRRLLVERLRAADVHQAAFVHYRNAVRQRERLDLVVRDVEDRHVRQFPVQSRDLLQHAAAQLRVQRRQRLVEQQNLRTNRQRPGDGDPLLLAAGQLLRVALGVGPHADQIQAFAAPGSRSRRAALYPRAGRRRRSARRACAGTARTAAPPCRCRAGAAASA